MELINFIESYLSSDNPIVSAFALGILAFCSVEIIGIVFGSVFSLFRKR